jgi:4a-hydroxytetrahydrobiopterin dehydratase
LKTVDELAGARCRPRSTGAMPETEIRTQLQALPEWRLERGAIVRDFRFSNYYETMAFVNALAYIAHAEDHHPQLAVTYDRCEVRFSTHSVAGISENDFICAAKVDRIFAQHAGSHSA